MMRSLAVLLLCIAAVHSQECGRSRPRTPPTRIVGGRNAVEREFPWQLSLQVRSRNNRWFHVCGASVLSPTRALTAAHCYMANAKYRVVAGLHNQNTMDNGDVQTAEVAKFTTHEKYNSPDALMNDIAVLSLATPLNMTEAVEPVCLPSKEMRMSADSMITVSGWGTTREGGSPSETLLAVDVPVVTDNQCNEMYSRPAFGLSSLLPFGLGTGGKSNIKETMLCAGFKEGEKDSCQGDSGGPAVSKQENGGFEQIGVVSWGKGCARKNTPGVYTEVPYFIDWINERMQ